MTGLQPDVRGYYAICLVVEAQLHTAIDRIGERLFIDVVRVSICLRPAVIDFLTTFCHVLRLADERVTLQPKHQKMSE